jgi:hypothetical protein
MAVELIELFSVQVLFRLKTRCFVTKFKGLARTLVFKAGASGQSSPGLYRGQVGIFSDTNRTSNKPRRWWLHNPCPPVGHSVETPEPHLTARSCTV